MKREDAIIRLAVLIFIGGGLNACLIVLAIQEFTRQNGLELSKDQIPFITTSPELTILYLGVGIAYSIGTSLIFTPKIIVSPLYIQFVTATILFTIINTYEFYAVSDFTITGYFIITELFIIITIYGILFLAGWLQRWVVRKMLGVNGTRENIYEKTYRINSSFDEIAKIIKEKHFLQINKFIIKSNLDNKLVLQTTSMKEKHVLALVCDEKNNNVSFLTLTSYLIKFDWLQKPESITGHEGIVGSIERLAKTTDHDVQFIELNEDKHSTNLALNFTMKETISLFGELNNYSKKPLIILGILLSIIFSVSLIHMYDSKIISTDTVINTLIFVSLAIFIDIYPSLKDKIQSR